MTHSRVSSGTRQKKTIRETHVRFFRNAPKQSARHSCVSSGTRQKYPHVTHAFLQERVQKTSEVSSGTPKNIREMLVRFFRDAPKNRRDTRTFLQELAKKTATHSRVSSGMRVKKSAKCSRVSSGTHQKKSARHSRVSSGTRQQIRGTLARSFRNAHLLGCRY